MNKNLFLFIFGTLFVIRHDSSQDVYIKFDGMTQDQIAEMYQKDGVSFNFINEKTYQDFLLAQNAIPKPIDPTIAIKTQAVLDAKNSSLTAAKRIDALIKAIDLK